MEIGTEEKPFLHRVGGAGREEKKGMLRVQRYQVHLGF